MNKQTHWILIAALALGIGCHGALAQNPGAFKLKHLSTFSDAPERNPFWPVGWVKTAAASAAVPEEPTIPISEKNFTVTTISISSTPLAVINGKTYGEGETMIANYGGQKLKILVAQINDGEVVLLYQGSKIRVPLKRPELNSHAATEKKELEPQPDSTIILH